MKIIAIREDTSALFKMLNPEVLSTSNIGISGGISSVGTNVGLENFKILWRLDSGKYSMVWEVILQSIKIGGTYGSPYDSTWEIFTIPYMNAMKHLGPFFGDFHPKYEIGNIDTLLGSFICFKPHVPAYEKPDSTSKIIAYLTYDLVELDRYKSYQASQDSLAKFQCCFNFVTTLDKKTKGWIYEDYCCILKRANSIVIEKINHQWKISIFGLFD
ncbi:MAG: hypothetical protein IPP29_13840 [Bacteroidetes bacterium]|nr:hypothetical protein [Bacteroidota bacterium]